MAYSDKAKERAWRLPYQRQWMKVRADRWRAVGACTKCGVPVKRFKMCGECRRQAAQWQQARRNRQPPRFCAVHPWTQIRMKGCRTCAGIRNSQKGWEGKATKQNIVREALLAGWKSSADVADGTGLSNVEVRSALSVFRRLKYRGWLRLESRTGWNTETNRPVCFYRLVQIDARASAA